MMADEQIYVGQESLEMRLDTNIDISVASELKIKYKKPSGTSGEFVGVLFGTTSVKYIFLDGEDELDEPGTWLFWAWAEMADGREIPGKPVEIYIKTEGTL